MVVIFFGRGEDGRIEMAAMAGAAGYGHARVVDLADVVRIDVLNHLEHQAGGILLRLGVIGEVQAWLSVGSDVLGIGGVAGAALGAERGFPLMHEVVNFFAGHRLGENLEVCRGGLFVVVSGLAGLRWFGRSLSGGGDSEDGIHHGRQEGDVGRGRKLQAQSSSRFGMDSIVMTRNGLNWLTNRLIFVGRKRRNVSAGQSAGASLRHG